MSTRKDLGGVRVGASTGYTRQCKKRTSLRQKSTSDRDITYDHGPQNKMPQKRRYAQHGDGVVYDLGGNALEKTVRA